MPLGYVCGPIMLITKTSPLKAKVVNFKIKNAINAVGFCAPEEALRAHHKRTQAG